LLLFSSITTIKMPRSQQRTKTTTTRGTLAEVVKAQLLLDIVTNPLFTCDQIINLPDRDYKSQSITAIRNRINYLVRLKKNDPSNFWLLYSAANKTSLSGPYRDKEVEEESVDSDDEETPSTPSRRKTQRTPATISTPSSSSNSTNKMSGSRSKITSPPATSAFAYNTMFESLKEAEDSGELSLMSIFCSCASSIVFF
jgi:hypothetical protein